MAPIKRTEPNTNWVFARRGEAIFAYYGFATMPTYVFRRKAINHHYIGHGQRFMSQQKVEQWVREQPKPKSQN